MFISISFGKEIISGIAAAEVKEVKMMIRPSEFRGNLSLVLEFLCKSNGKSNSQQLLHFNPKGVESAHPKMNSTLKMVQM